MDRWRRYLFESHAESTLRSWANRLHFFRFFRAIGGHANDGDSLDVVFRYGTVEEMTDFLHYLGIRPVYHAEKPPQPEVGVSYPWETFNQFPSLIPGTEWLEQPGHCLVSGQSAFVWCERERIRISVGGNYVVDELHVRAAEAIEPLLAGVALERIDPPLDTHNYICPKYYPEWFNTGA